MCGLRQGSPMPHNGTHRIGVDCDKENSSEGLKPESPSQVPKVLLISSVIFSCNAHKSCKCCNHDQQGRDSNNNRSISLDNINYPIMMGSGTLWSSLYDLRNSCADHVSSSSLKSSIDDVGLLIAGQLDSVSFSASFNMSSYLPPNRTTQGLVFAILPLPYSLFSQNNSHKSMLPMFHNMVSHTLSNTSKPMNVCGSSILVQIGEAKMSSSSSSSFVSANIIIKPEADTAPNCTVRIDYDGVGRHISVYVSDPTNPQNATTHNVCFTISRTTNSNISMGFCSTIGQLSKIYGLSMIYQGVSSSEHRSLRLVVIFSSVLGPVATAAIMASAAAWYFNSKYMKWKKDLDHLAKSMQRLPGVPMQVNFADINKATNNFHQTMKLGTGGFGAVYRCSLPDSDKGLVLEVAVKKFTRDDNRRYDDFLAEVSIINRLRHKNIVPLVGWSYNKGVPLLVYEYMTNGSLDQHLFPRSVTGQQRPTATVIHQWHTRYYIAMDIVTGLHYVHHEYEPMVLHRDIKASNIMLDSNFRGRIGDFGLACTVAINRNSVSGIAGTWGYIAPEYLHSHKATRQTDIFALGVLILEIVTGKRALPNDMPLFEQLTDWVWHLHRKGRLLQAVDPMITAGHHEFDADEAKRLLLLGLACSNPNPSDRPSMVEALQVIAKSTPPPEVPLEKPTFIWDPPDIGPSLSNSSDYNTAMSTPEVRILAALPSIVELVEEPTDSYYDI